MKRIIFYVCLITLLLVTAGRSVSEAIIINASGDTMISDGGVVPPPDDYPGDYTYFRNTNWGSSIDITVNWWAGFQNMGLIKFDISPISGTTVNSAMLNLFRDVNSGNATFGVFNLTSDWDASVVTWNTAPTYDATPVATLSFSSSNNQNGWFEWDMTALVQQWQSGASSNYGIMLMRIDQINPEFYFAATEYQQGSYAPNLEINGVDSVPEPTSMLLLGLGLTGIAGLRRKIRK